MKNKSIPVAIIAIIAIIFSASRFLQHASVGKTDYDKPVYVSRVIDGDTIELSNGESVRYIGIDTPESREREGGEWVYDPMPYAKEAIELNRKLVEGKAIRLEFDVQKRDKYNRLLAYVYSGDKMVNLEMLKQGYSMIYTYPPNVKYAEEFLRAQQSAREQGKGLWADFGKEAIPASEVRENIGLIKEVEAEIMDTYLSDSVLILNCRDNFKAVIFKNNLGYFPKGLSRSPDAYFKYKTIRIYGVIKEYKGAYEIVLNDPSQLKIME